MTPPSGVPRPAAPGGSAELSLPLVRVTTFAAETAREHAARLAQGQSGFYQRLGHPTVAAVERQLAMLEGAEDALLTSSGMAAIATALLTVLRPGDQIVAHHALYGHTAQLLNGLLASLGVETAFVDARNPDAVRRAVRANTRALYAETPSNPMLDILDIRALGEIAAAHQIELLVDSTFGSPVLQQPLRWGATLVLHSGTKFLGGHSDLMCGVAAGRAELIGRLRETQTLLGSVLAPDVAWLLARSLRTLDLRVARQSRSALELAQRLSSHPGVVDVRYPLLEGTPGATVARRQMTGGGGVVTFEVRGDPGAGAAVLDRLRTITIATSLGGVESLVELPFALCLAEPGGIPPTEPANVIRLSVGLEAPDALWADLVQALEPGSA